MGAKTKIEWTATLLPDGSQLPGFTFNPWIGCSKTSPGCQFCYAEAQNHRWGKNNWGTGKPRDRTTETYWRQPIGWNKTAAASCVRRKVFCASLADVFDDEVPDEWRRDLFALIAKTPHLDWLLLTKRPENIAPFLRRLDWCSVSGLTSATLLDGPGPGRWYTEGPMPNVWLGTTVEDQARTERIMDLLLVPAAIHFLSVEPQLEHVDLRRSIYGAGTIDVLSGGTWDMEERYGFVGHSDMPAVVSWVICGAESGASPRPFDLAWARSIVAQCAATNTPVFVKQVGKHPFWDGLGVPPPAHIYLEHAPTADNPHRYRLDLLRDAKGGSVEDFPEDLRIRQWPAPVCPPPVPRPQGVLL